MLSGETTVGKYPLKCIEVFDRISHRIERSGGANFWEYAELTDDPREKIAKSAVVMANEARAHAIVSLIPKWNYDPLSFLVASEILRHLCLWRRNLKSPVAWHLIAAFSLW